MRFPGLKTLKKRYRQVRSRFVRGGIILGYHRIAAGVDDPYGICVSPTHFSAQMAYLRRHMHPLPLTQFVERALAGTLPPRAVAVTFDDGYADNLHTAHPILAEHQIPATLFVTAGILGREFWWDELVRVIRSRPSTDWQTTVPRLQNHTLSAFYNWLLPLSDTDRQAHLEKLWATVGGTQAGPSLLLREGELKTLAAHSLWEIGSHTLTHPSLHLLAPDEQRREIAHSRIVIETLVGRPVQSFSYPNGRFSAVTRDLIQEAGYTVACASHADIVWGRSDPLCLPRIWAKNDTVARFSDGWIHAGVTAEACDIR